LTESSIDSNESPSSCSYKA